MAEWIELIITALFFFAVLFLYFQFVSPMLDGLMGTSATPGSAPS